MLPRHLKVAFYTVLGPFMAANGAWHRTFRRPRGSVVKAQLGPGQRNYLPGWVNVDANIFSGQADIWADLRNKLPFPDASVDVFYSHHVIEHLPDLEFHFAELYRCLKPGGAFRIGGPNGDAAIRKFVEGDMEWFGTFPVERASIGGRLENFIFCKGEHLTILTESYLVELSTRAGFAQQRTCAPAVQTHYPHLIGNDVLALETASRHGALPHTLVVEGVKPRC